jgi:hypothetical protein
MFRRVHLEKPTVTQLFIKLLQNSKFHNGDHSNPPLINVLNHINAVYSHISCFVTIHFNITFQPTLMSSKWSVRLRYSD